VKPPDVVVVAGRPTEAETSVARAAVLSVWRDDLAAAARATKPGGWESAARSGAIAERDAPARPGHF